MAVECDPPIEENETDPEDSVTKHDCDVEKVTEYPRDNEQVSNLSLEKREKRNVRLPKHLDDFLVHD